MIELALATTELLRPFCLHISVAIEGLRQNEWKTFGREKRMTFGASLNHFGYRGF